MSARISRSQINRELARVSLTATLATTASLGFEEFAGGTVYIPSGSPITLLTYYCAPYQPSQEPATEQDIFTGNVRTDATYYALADATNTAVTQAVTAGRCYSLPVEAFGAGSIKIVVDNAGGVEISLKG